MISYCIIVTFFIFSETLVIAGNNSCSTVSLLSNTCAKGETCKADKYSPNTGKCECLPEYIRVDGICVLEVSTDPPTHETPSARVVTDAPPSTSTSGVSSAAVVAGVFAAIVFIAAGFGLFYSARRYHWLQWLRQRRQRQYDEMHIGHDDDDDPPIA